MVCSCHADKLHLQAGNFLLTQAVGYFIDKILKFSQTVHEKEWGQRMTQKPELYQWIKGLVDAYLEILEREHTPSNLLAA